MAPSGPALARALALGTARWPGVRLTAQALARHAARWEVGDDTLVDRAEDLVLAVACAEGDEAALVAFDREFLTQIPTYVGRLSLAVPMLEDLRADLRLRLLHAQPPRIASYAGQGPLGAWLRVIAVRAALDALEATNRRPLELNDSQLAPAVADQHLPDSAVAVAWYRPLFQAAIEQSLTGLSARDKAVLRFHFVEGLNIEAIGAIYRVHRATVARWLADINRRLLADIQQRLATDLGARSGEFESLLALVRSELGASLSRVLGG